MDTNALMQQALGIPVQQSPVYTAKFLLKDCYKGREKVIRDTTFDLRDLPFNESAYDLVWKRALTPDMIGKYVHHYDKSSMYLSACSNTDTGIGDPIHLAGGNDGTPIVPGLPGIYRISYTVPFLGYAPPIIELGQEWVTNDILLFAQSRNYDITIREAWVFPDYAKVLGHRDDKRNWAKRQWNALQFLKPLDKEAYREMKVVTHVGMGSFATGKEKYPGLHLIHPNWWGDVVGKARMNMLCNIEKYGVPVLVETDGVYYVSRESNYRMAVPGILDRMGQLGGYKHEGSFLLTEDIYNSTRNKGVGEVTTLFKSAEGGEQ